ncbi:MAG: hypothetical protein FJ304_19815 [Planctomycetes bacterium]|nr:hypothetical protein [Planctomycetota bacterium]
MATAAGALLALYLLGIVFALLAPPKQHDPQRGQAVGCLMLVALVLIGLGALLAAGVAFEIEWLTRAVAYVVFFPAVLLAINAARFAWLKLTGRM